MYIAISPWSSATLSILEFPWIQEFFLDIISLYPAALNVLVQPCDIPQQFIDETNVGAGQLIALVLGLGGNWVDQPEHWHPLKRIFLYTINFCKHVLEIFLHATIYPTVLF